ncbi:MAG TPA: hypothetical protein VLG71_02990 [Candidatus Limnocylindria bacterium]|nr:hypothetical protein [Candidatus Limnocylindria bacterium]
MSLRSTPLLSTLFICLATSLVVQAKEVMLDGATSEYQNFELHKQAANTTSTQEKRERKKNRRQSRKERKQAKKERKLAEKRQKQHEQLALEMHIDAINMPTNDVEWNKLAMDAVFQDINGFRVTSEEQDMVVARGGFPTYGEITYESLQTLIDELKLTERDVFADGGSGCGRVVTQIYLNSPVKKACGFELCETRYLSALEAKERLKERDMLDDRDLLYYNQNMLDLDVSELTVFYTCATCFSHELMLALTKKLSQAPKGLRVLTLKELPAYDLYGFKFVKEFNLAMTWSPEGSPVYMYELVG